LTAKRQIFTVFLYAIGIVTLITSCNSETETPDEAESKSTISEGCIYFGMTYPYFDDDFMIKILPKTMTMEFKDNVYKNTVSKGGLFTTSLISDCNKKKVIMILDFSMKQIYCELDADQAKQMVDTLFIIPDLIPVQNTQNLLDFTCEKHTAVYSRLEDGYDCDIYTAENIKIENSNWCNQYFELPNVMLGYEAAQYGLVTRFKADSIEAKSIDSKIFQVAPTFKKVSFEQMMYEMEEIFKQFI
jgi:hypothetical protein